MRFCITLYIIIIGEMHEIATTRKESSLGDANLLAIIIIPASISVAATAAELNFTFEG